MIEPAYQSKTIRAVGIILTVVYISSSALQVDQETLLKCIGKMSRNRAIISGDVNAQHIAWNTRGDARGSGLAKWAKDNNWVISTPNEPTCHIARGSSTPDIILTRGITQPRTMVLISMT